MVSEDDTFRATSVEGGGGFVNRSMDKEAACPLTKAHVENLEGHEALAPFTGTLNPGFLDPAISGVCAQPGQVPRRRVRRFASARRSRLIPRAIPAR